MIVSGVDVLPAWAAADLAGLFGTVRGAGPQPSVITAERYDGIPEALAALVDAIVEVPARRLRPDDVLPLAHHPARQRPRRGVHRAGRPRAR